MDFDNLPSIPKKRDRKQERGGFRGKRRTNPFLNPDKSEFKGNPLLLCLWLYS